MIIIFSNYITYITIFLISSLLFARYYKVASQKSKKDGALTVLLEQIAGVFCILLIPLFEFKISQDIRVYILLLLSVIFYAINDRINTKIRRNLEISIVAILRQLSSIFLIFLGLIFFKEEFILTKFIGSFLIIFSNVLVFLDKDKLKINRDIIFGILANICISMAMFLDINISKSFTLPLYIWATLIFPSILIFFVERLKICDIIGEYKSGEKKAIIITGVSWGVMIFSQLRAYQLGQVTKVAPLCALSIIINVIAGILLFGEKENIIKKIIASILIVFSLILINL